MLIDLKKTNTYRTRSGKKAVVHKAVDDLPDHFRFVGFVEEENARGSIGQSGRMWSHEGYARRNSEGIIADDIVDAWSDEPERPEPVKPIVDWSKYPDYIKFLAMDNDGEWYGYTHKPTVCGDCDMFEVDEDEPYSTRIFIPEASSPEFAGDWSDSLVDRPAEAKKSGMDIPWEKIPEEYMVVAMEEDGDWWAFKYVPFPYLGWTSGQWSRGVRNVCEGDIRSHRILDDLGISLPRFPGDWQDSIHIRPGADPIQDHE